MGLDPSAGLNPIDFSGAAQIHIDEPALMFAMEAGSILSLQRKENITLRFFVLCLSLLLHVDVSPLKLNPKRPWVLLWISSVPADYDGNGGHPACHRIAQCLIGPNLKLHMVSERLYISSGHSEPRPASDTAKDTTICWHGRRKNMSHMC